MNVNDRRQAILEIINKEGQVRAVELASRLNVTGETIRKDLIYLSDKNLLRKNHGSAQAISEFIERSVDARAQENAMFKREIARTALDQLNNCSVIFIDSGSTLMEMAKLLSKRPDLAIITNSFSILQTLMDSENTIYFIGGEVASVTQSTSGFWAASELQSIRIDIAFLGTSGFQSHSGPCTKTFPDAQLKKEVLRNSNRIVVLADHTKFSTNAIVQFAEWKDIDLLITDNRVTQEQIATLEDAVDIVITPVPQ